MVVIVKGGNGVTAIVTDVDAVAPNESFTKTIKLKMGADALGKVPLNTPLVEIFRNEGRPVADHV